MKKLSKIEIFNSIPLLLILGLIIICPSYIPKLFYYLCCLILVIRFIRPFIFIFPKYLYIDFSKIINSLIWFMIVILINYIDRYTKYAPLEKKATLTLLIFYVFFLIMRGAFYIMNKQEPIIKPKGSEIGDFVKSINRKITKEDSDYTIAYMILFVIVIIITVNM